MATAAIPGTQGLDQVLGWYRQQSQPDMDAIKQAQAGTAAARQNLVDVTRQSVPAPHMQPLPRAPGQPDQSGQQVMAAFAAPMFMLALFGSRKTRMSMVPALRASTAMMQGQAAANQQQYERDRQTWHDNLQQAIQENNQLLETYRAAVDKHRDDMAAAQAEVTAAASAAGDTITLAQMKQGDMRAAMQTWQALQFHADQMSMESKRLGMEGARIGLEERRIGMEGQRLDEQHRHNLALEDVAQQNAATRAGTAGAKSAAAQQRLDNVIGQVDKILDPKNPDSIYQQNENTALGATGIRGWASRRIETVLNNLGVSSGTSAADFQTQLETLKAEVAPLIVGNSRTAKDQRERLDTIIRGVGFGDTLASTQSSLIKLRDLLKELKTQPAEAGATDTGGEAPVPGAKQAPDGKWYVEKDGQWFRVEPDEE